jgi:hypothetical protein
MLAIDCDRSDLDSNEHLDSNDECFKAVSFKLYEGML